VKIYVSQAVIEYIVKVSTKICLIFLSLKICRYVFLKGNQAMKVSAKTASNTDIGVRQ
jgi:hypothetical protein